MGNHGHFKGFHSQTQKDWRKRIPLRKKRQFEMGRPAANTKLGPKRIHSVRCRGGNIKYRALRLDSGNFNWATEATTAKTRLLTVLYNASNNELVRTNTLVKTVLFKLMQLLSANGTNNTMVLILVRKRRMHQKKKNKVNMLLLNLLVEIRKDNLKLLLLNNSKLV